MDPIDLNVYKTNKKEGLIFTRYLYIKDEVKAVLLMSLLQKKESALFWAYELYYSGFEQELFDYLFAIYYDFYYILNPGFQDYLIKKYNEWLKHESLKHEEEEEKNLIVALIVQTLLLRPHNTDIFTLRTQTDNTSSEKDLKKMLENENYMDISHYINNIKTDMEITPTLEIVYEFFQKSTNKTNNPNNMKKIVAKFLKTNNYYNPNIQLLAHIMNQFALFKGITMSKNMYVIVEPYDILIYETISKNPDLKSHHILPMACMYSIEEHEYLNLFSHLERDTIPFEELQKKYWYHWLYYASFSPIWLKRIHLYNGQPDHSKESILFPNEDDEEAFYQEFGYEPDEQKREVQDKNIPKLTRV